MRREKGLQLFEYLLPMISGSVLGISVIHILYKERCEKTVKRSNKFELFQDTMTKWVAIREIDKTLIPFVADMGIRTVAIYGMRTLGKCIKNEFKGSEIEVIYAIDEKADSIYSDIDIIKPSDGFPEVDAIIVTSVDNYSEIKTLIKDKTIGKIISIADLINEVYSMFFTK